MSLYLATAGTYIRRSPYQSLAAVFILALTFFVGTLLAVLVYVSSSVINYFETLPQIIAFLKDDVTSESISALQRKLATDQRIGDVGYVSKEEALEIYKQGTSDNPLLSELVNPSVFPASLEFSVKNLDFAESVVREIEKEPIVSQIGFTASLGDKSSLGDVIERLKQITTYLRFGGLIVFLVLTSVSFLTLLVVIGMRISVRKDEVEILRLIGASSSFIRTPFILEALFYSLMGSFVGWAIAVLFVLYITPSLKGYFGQIPVLPPTFEQIMIFFGLTLLIEFAVATVLGVLGSFVAISRYLKV